MKVGLIARAEDRGLGIQTWEFARHVHPDRILVVDLGPLARGFQPHLDRYPDATVVPFIEGQLPSRIVQDWLDGLDVVFTAETLYDWRLADWARARRVATVVQVNPEFYRHGRDRTPAPTVWWAPTPWRMAHLDPATRLVPVPVAADRFPLAPPPRADRLRVLHSVGHRAAMDRNGTQLVLQALRSVSSPLDVRVATQDGHVPRSRLPRHVQLTVTTGGHDDYWRVYDDADVLVLPRRYGGLCLPVQEAMAAGLAVVMPDCSPNEWWPTVRVPAVAAGDMNATAGRVPLHKASPLHLARTLDQLARTPAVLDAAQAAAVGWARAHSWEALLPLYRAELEAAAERGKPVSRTF